MDQALLDRIISSPRLPSMPAVALEVIDLVRDPNVDIDDLATTIANDPALASKILKTVNSSFYAQSRTIASILQALVVMGLNSVRTLALGFTLTDNLRRNSVSTKHFDYNYFWQRCLLSGTAARSIAARLSPAYGEEAFLAVLLHQLGVLAMRETIGDAYDNAGSGAWGDGHMLSQREQEAFDLSHTIVGQTLADAWELPPRLTDCLRWYTNPDAADPESIPIVRIVAIADFIATVFLGPDPGRALQQLQQRADEWFGINSAGLESLITTVRADTEEMGALLEVAPEDIPSASEILARANEALAQITLEATQRASAPEDQNHELASLVSTDALTGLANRRGFDDFLAQQICVAVRYHRSLSLLILDLDRFKDVNDTYGHPVGDEVLRAFGAVLLSSARDSDIVARQGGDEFALVLPDTELSGALALANRIRGAVEALKIPGPDGATIRITISAGVATLDRDDPLQIESLIADADAGLYTAKRAGGNRSMVRRATRAA